VRPFYDNHLFPDEWFLRVSVQTSWLIALSVFKGFNGMRITDIEIQLPYARTCFGQGWIEDAIEEQLRENVDLL